MTREITPSEALPQAPTKRRRRRIVAAAVAALVLSGTGVAYANHSFPDVPGNVYFHNAVAWAKSNGITTGYGNTGQFNPHANITRAEVVTLQHRYHKKFTPTQTIAARIGEAGNLISDVGVTSASHPGTGQYSVTFDRSDIAKCWFSITPHAAAPVIVSLQNVLGKTATVRVMTHAGVAVDSAFFITATCANAT